MRKKRTRLKMKNIMIVSIVLLLISMGTFYVFKEKYRGNLPLEKSQTEHHEVGKIESIIEYGELQSVGMHYPYVDVKELDDVMSEYIQTSRNNFSKENEKHKDFILEKNLKPELNIDYESFKINDDLFSVRFDYIVSSPLLAHPDVQKKTYLFSKKDKKELSLEDVMKNDYLNKISNLVRIKLKENVDYKDYFFEDLFLEKTAPSVDNFKKFILTNDQLIIYFDKYEILPGSKGVPIVTIDLDEIKYYLNFKVESPDEDSSTTVKPVDPPKNEIDPNKPMIALTFDDGPHPKYTNQILDTLRDYNAHGTFYVLGNRVLSYTDIIVRMMEEGNEIGNHSYSHRDLTKLTQQELNEQINKTQNNILEIVNIKPKTLRPTYGAYNEFVKEHVNLPFVLWSLDTEDWKYRDTKKIVDNVLTNVKDGDIILFHDIYGTTADAVEVIVRELTKQGYQMVTVSEMLEIKHGTLEAGVTYSHK